jgi:hypothetical protein
LTPSSFELEFKGEGLKGGRAQRRRYLEEEEGVKGGDFRRKRRRRKGRSEGS